jgi:outer membrane protein assembly factor BamB/SAM-dependent methyltransferase
MPLRLGLGLLFSGCPLILRSVRMLRRSPIRSNPGVAWVTGQRLGLALLLTTAAHGASEPSGGGASDADRKDSNAAVQGTQIPRSFRFRVPPHARFVAPDAAVISWETDEPSECVIGYGIGEKLDRQIRDGGVQTTHRIAVRGLEPKAHYQYRIRAKPPEKDASVGEVFELDNALNYAVAAVPDATSPYGSDSAGARYSRAAEQILSATGVTRGYCLVLGCNEGQLAYELAKRSELILIGVDNDRDRITRARTLLRKAGVYGSRITLHHVASLDSLPFPRSFANLIVSDGSLATGKLPAAAAQVLPLLQPATGVACLGPFPSAARLGITNQVAQWLGEVKVRWDLADSDAELWIRVRRDLPLNTGSWTHQYGDAGNSANSQESLEGVASTDRLGVQWLGRPGADFGIDRNPRMPAPLAVNGRLFHQGLNRIVGLDSYNGAILWSLEIPALRRVNMPRDCGNWCADPDRLYVAIKDRCWMIAAATGELIRTLPLADPGLRESHEWGYVARAGDLLYGSSIKQGAVYTNFWGKQSWYDATSGSGTEKICSDDLFALASESGELKWQYHNGVVINSTIAVANGKVLFVECRDPEIRALPASRVGSPKLWYDQHLVALDARTGNKLWDQPIDTVDGIVVFYLLAASNEVFIMASAAGKYHLYAYSGTDGKCLWQAAHDWTNNNHGGHLQHPVVVRNTVFLEPCGYDVATGKLLTRDVGRHAGCATYAATLNALIYRGDSACISMWDIEHGVTTSWHNLRPSCWLSTVPANGMVLSPEGGGGCSCGNWLETSIGFAPVLNPTTK